MVALNVQESNIWIAHAILDLSESVNTVKDGISPFFACQIIMKVL